MCPSTGARGETLHFSIPSINQAGSFGSIFLALATPSTMVPTMPKAIFTFGYTLWMPLTVPLGFAPVCYLYKSQLYWSKKIIESRLVKRRWFCRQMAGEVSYFQRTLSCGLLTCGPMCQCFTKQIRFPHEAEQWQKQHVVNLKEMREKRIKALFGS